MWKCEKFLKTICFAWTIYKMVSKFINIIILMLKFNVSIEHDFKSVNLLQTYFSVCTIHLWIIRVEISLRQLSLLQRCLRRKILYNVAIFSMVFFYSHTITLCSPIRRESNFFNILLLLLLLVCIPKFSANESTRCQRATLAFRAFISIHTRQWFV